MILNAQETVFLHTAIKHEVDNNPHKKAQFDKILKKIEEAKPEKHGEWVLSEKDEILTTADGDKVAFYRCSKCNRLIMAYKRSVPKLTDFPYCHCGAKMNGGAE